MLPESLIAEPTVWSSSPRRFAVLWRPALIPAYAFIIAYLFMAGFVLHQSGIGQDVYVHGLISLFLWLGGYMVYSAYPNSGIVQSVTENFAVIRRGSPQGPLTIHSLYYLGGLKQDGAHAVRFTSFKPHMLDAGGLDGLSFVGLRDPAEILAIVRRRKLELGDTIINAGSPLVEFRRSSVRSLPIVLALLILAVIAVWLSAGTGPAVILFMLGYFVLVLGTFRDINVDRVSIAAGGLQLSNDDGGGVETVPWPDVFPLTVFGTSPMLPLCQGFSRLWCCPRRPGLTVHLHKAKASLDVPPDALRALLDRALAFAREQRAPVPECVEPDVGMTDYEGDVDGGLGARGPNPWAHYRHTAALSRDGWLLSLTLALLLLVLFFIDPTIALRALLQT